MGVAMDIVEELPDIVEELREIIADPELPITQDFLKLLLAALEAK